MTTLIDIDYNTLAHKSLLLEANVWHVGNKWLDDNGRISDTSLLENKYEIGRVVRVYSNRIHVVLHYGPKEPIIHWYNTQHKYWTYNKNNPNLNFIFQFELDKFMMFIHAYGHQST